MIVTICQCHLTHQNMGWSGCALGTLTARVRLPREGISWPEVAQFICAFQKNPLECPMSEV